MKQIGIISLALVLALGALGAAYAPWTDEVEIIQTVQTGALEVGVRGEATLEQDKDVAEFEVTHGTEKFLKDDLQYYESVTIAVTNAYPSLYIYETFYFAVGGSVPVHLAVELDFDDPDGLDPFVDTPGWTAILADVEIGSGTNWTQLVNFLEAQQLYPCDTLQINLTKHILETVEGEKCPMGAEITYTLKVTAYQYNWTP